MTNTTKDKELQEEYEPLAYEDNILFQIGYYFCEYLRHGNQYHDFDMLIKCLPYPLNEKCKTLEKVDG